MGKGDTSEEIGRGSEVSAEAALKDQIQEQGRMYLFGQVSSINTLETVQGIFFPLNQVKDWTSLRVQATKRIANMRSVISSLLGQQDSVFVRHLGVSGMRRPIITSGCRTWCRGDSKTALADVPGSTQQQNPMDVSNALAQGSAIFSSKGLSSTYSRLVGTWLLLQPHSSAIIA